MNKLKFTIPQGIF